MATQLSPALFFPRGTGPQPATLGLSAFRNAILFQEDIIPALTPQDPLLQTGSKG